MRLTSEALLQPSEAVPRWAIPALAAVCSAILLGFTSITNDDVHITLEYAKHLARLEGLVFNPGEWVLGLTNPLVAIVVGVLGLVTRAPILALAWVAALGALWAAVYAARWALQDELWTLALVPVLFLGPQTTHFVGNEFPLVCALGFTAIGAARRDRWLLAGLCVGGLYLARFDVVLLGPVLAARALVVHRGRSLTPLLRLALGTAPIIALWHLYSWLAYRQLFPLSLGAELDSYGSPLFIRFSRQLFTVHLDRAFVSGGALAVGLLLIGCVLAGAKALDLLGWAAVHAAFFSLLDLPGTKTWHFMIVELALLALVAAGVAEVSRRLSAERLRVALLAVGMSLSVGLASFGASKGELERFGFFTNLAEWMHANVPPTESVALREIGIIGFHTDNPIIDFGYLVTHPPATGAAAVDLRQQVANHRPQWAVLTRHVQFTPEETRGFTGYEVVAQGSTGEKSNVTILRRELDD